MDAAPSTFDPLTYYEAASPWASIEISEDRDRELLMAELHEGSFHPGMYRTFEIPKRASDPTGPQRVITAPNEELMQKQRLILDLLKAEHPWGSPVAHAYYAERSIRTMAQAHVARRWVIRIDLSSFFPNITRAMVGRSLRSRGVSASLIQLINKWCFLDGGLPQGAPTSPALSNITAGNLLDYRLIGFCDSWHTQRVVASGIRLEPIEYTRYADDLCFSSDYELLPKIIPPLRRIIEDAGFAVNEDKVKVMPSRGRQSICGVSLNRHLGKPRRWRYALKAWMHNVAMDVLNGRCPPGYMLVGDDRVPIPFARMLGSIQHVHYLNPRQAEILWARFNRIIEIHEGIYASTSTESASVRCAPGTGRHGPVGRHDAPQEHLGIGPDRGHAAIDIWTDAPLAGGVPAARAQADEQRLRGGTTADDRNGATSEHHGGSSSDVGDPGGLPVADLPLQLQPRHEPGLHPDVLLGTGTAPVDE